MLRSFTKQSLFAVVLLFGVLLVACAGQAVTPTQGVVVAAATPKPAEPTAVPPIDAPTTEPYPAAEATAPPSDAGAVVSFSKDVLPILQNRCLKCHGGDKTEKGLDLNTYASLISGSSNGAVIVPGDAANSKLISLINSGKMPKRGEKLTDAEIQLIQNWVNAGATDN